MIFLDEAVVLRAPRHDEEYEPPKRQGDYVASPDEQLVTYPDERWASYVVYPYRTDIW